jgi:hypothetical protein
MGEFEFEFALNASQILRIFVFACFACSPGKKKKKKKKKKKRLQMLFSQPAKVNS